MVPFGVYIAPQRSADHSWDADHLWDVRIETELYNAGSAGQSGMLRQELLDASGAVLAEAESSYTIGPRAEIKILQMIPAVKNIRLWSPESPSLYHIRTSVEEDTERCLSAYQTHSGRICTGVEEDSVENSFGFREIALENFDGCEQQSIDQQKLSGKNHQKRTRTLSGIPSVGKMHRWPLFRAASKFGWMQKMKRMCGLPGIQR